MEWPGYAMKVQQTAADQSNPCLKEQRLSYKCLSDHNYNRSYCSEYFENYRNCKAFWNKVRLDRKRSGNKPYIPAVEDRERVQAEYFAKPGFR